MLIIGLTPRGDKLKDLRMKAHNNGVFGCWTFILSSLLLLASTVADRNCSRTFKVNQQVRLEQCLLKNYKANVRPNHHKTATEVMIEFVAMDVRFSSKYKMFNIMGILKADWTDQFLAWDPTDFGGIDLTQIESSNIWTPPLVYEGVVGSPLNSLFSNTMTDIRSGGNVSYMNFVAFTSMCTSQLLSFPRDEHECMIRIQTMEVLKFHLLSTNGLQPKDMTIVELVNLMMSGYNVEAQQFEMQNVTLSVEEYEYSLSQSANTQDIIIQVKLRRNTSRFSFIYLGVYATSFLLLIPLLMPASSLVRMSLHLITFFASLYWIGRIDNIVNIYTAEDVPTIVIYYRNIALMSLFMIGEAFLHILLTELPLQLPETLEKQYHRVNQQNVYENLRNIIWSLRARSGFEHDSLVEDTINTETKPTFKDLIQVVDTYISYLVILLVIIFYLQLIT